MITRKQQKAAFAIIKRIAKVNEESTVVTYAQLKQAFNTLTDMELSLSSTCPGWMYDMFIEWITEVFIWIGAESEQTLSVYFEDIEKYLAICIKHRICCVCGKPNADLHHSDRLGRGISRRDADHKKYKRMALCRDHHQENHQHGEKTFCDKYKVKGIITDYHPSIRDSLDEDLSI